MPVAKNIVVPNIYVTQGTWDRLMPVKKITFITSRDIYCQVKNSSWETFQATGIDEFTVPAGYVSKTFALPVYGFRFRSKDAIPATVEFFTD